MGDVLNDRDSVNNRIVDNSDEHVPPASVEGAHDADGTMGRTAGTGAGAISGGIVGASVAGPVGAVVGAVAGGVLGAAGGNAAHRVGDDHDDVNVDTGSGGDLGKNAGMGVGSISGAVVGATAGPVGAVAGAVAGGMLGAAAGDGAKDMGGDGQPNVNTAGHANTGAVGTTIGTTSSDTDVLPGNDVSGVQNGGYTTAGPDTRGVTEKAADAITNDNIDDKHGGRTL